MSTPLIYQKNDEVRNSGTYSKDIIDGPGGKQIELNFKPRNSISIRSRAFIFAKNKMLDWGLGLTWDNTGAMKVYIEEGPRSEGMIRQVLSLVAWTYSKILDYDGFSSDEFVEFAPGMWVLESDLRLALDEKKREKLFEVLSEIFTERPRMLLITGGDRQ